jgi:hypothetical protein
MGIWQRKIQAWGESSSAFLKAFPGYFDEYKKHVFTNIVSPHIKDPRLIKTKRNLVSLFCQDLNNKRISLASALEHTLSRYPNDQCMVERIWDELLGINTSDYLDIRQVSTKHHDGLPYIPTGYLNLSRIIQYLQQNELINNGTIIAEIGAGAARFSCCLAVSFPLKKIICLEINPLLAERAKNNLLAVTIEQVPRPAIEVVCGDAADITISGAHIYYLYKPFELYKSFEQSTLYHWLTNLEKDLEQNKRRLYIVYVGAEQEDNNTRYFHNTPWLKNRAGIDPATAWIWRSK